MEAGGRCQSERALRFLLLLDYHDAFEDENFSFAYADLELKLHLNSYEDK